MKARPVAKYRVIFVLTLKRKTFRSTLQPTIKRPAVIPASGALGKIPADCRHIAYGRRCNSPSRLRQRSKPLDQRGIRLKLTQPGHAADPTPPSSNRTESMPGIL